jgi:hypothetical protein
VYCVLGEHSLKTRLEGSSQGVDVVGMFAGAVLVSPESYLVWIMVLLSVACASNVSVFVDASLSKG